MLSNVEHFFAPRLLRVCFDFAFDAAQGKVGRFHLKDIQRSPRLEYKKVISYIFQSLVISFFIIRPTPFLSEKKVKKAVSKPSLSPRMY